MGVALHKEYCADITDAARDALEDLMKKKQAMDAQMREIIEQKKARDQVQASEVEKKKKNQAEVMHHREDEALRLINTGTEIGLGKDLASKTLGLEKKPVVEKKVKEPKPPPKPKVLKDKDGSQDSGSDAV